MGLIKKIFGRSKEKQVFPNRALDLPLEPIPENGIELSNLFCEVVKKNEGIDLDYSVESLSFVDQFLEDFSKELSVMTFAETIFVAGCYAGQIMVVNANGKWIKQEDADLPEGINMLPIVIKLPNGGICDPIAKAFKRFANGESDNLTFFYQVLTTQDEV